MRNTGKQKSKTPTLQLKYSDKTGALDSYRGKRTSEIPNLTPKNDVVSSNPFIFSIIHP